MCLHRYVNEFTHPHNSRDMDFLGMNESMVWGYVGNVIGLSLAECQGLITKKFYLRVDNMRTPPDLKVRHGPQKTMTSWTGFVLDVKSTYGESTMSFSRIMDFLKSIGTFVIAVAAVIGLAGWLLDGSLNRDIQANTVAIEANTAEIKEVKTEIKEVKTEIRVSYDKIEQLIRSESERSDADRRAAAVEMRELRDHIAKLTTDQAILEERYSQITSSR